MNAFQIPCRTSSVPMKTDRLPTDQSMLKSVTARGPPAANRPKRVMTGHSAGARMAAMSVEASAAVERADDGEVVVKDRVGDVELAGAAAGGVLALLIGIVGGPLGVPIGSPSGAARGWRQT
jgi:hypothetical protein